MEWIKHPNHDIWTLSGTSGLYRCIVYKEGNFYCGKIEFSNFTAYLKQQFVNIKEAERYTLLNCQIIIKEQMIYLNDDMELLVLLPTIVKGQKRTLTL